jgi:hypothetical protein
MLDLTIHDEGVLEEYRDGKVTKSQLFGPWGLNYLTKDEAEFAVKMVEEGKSINEFAIVRRRNGKL